jgi:hypothetical protein
MSQLVLLASQQVRLRVPLPRTRLAFLEQLMLLQHLRDPQLPLL